MPLSHYQEMGRTPNTRFPEVLGIIQPMNEPLKFKPFGVAALILLLAGGGGLYYIITQTLPYVWSRWGFFLLTILALTGAFLPIIYLFHKRLAGENPIEAHIIVRQAVWFGFYGATLAWLQLGRLVTVYVILALAGGLIAIEYFIRLREKSRWKPPAPEDE